jgi:hypothetical protein
VDTDEVIECLTLGATEFQSGAFLFNQQRAWPEQIDKTLLVIEQLYALFIHRHSSALDAEDFEKVVVKALGFTLFVMGVFPVFAKRLGASFDFVPAKPHSENSPFDRCAQIRRPVQPQQNA